MPGLVPGIPIREAVWPPCRDGRAKPGHDGCGWQGVTIMIPNAWTGFDFGLGDDVERLRDTVRGFAQDEIAPRAEEIDRSNTFPRDLWPRMGSLGLHGITVEEEFGGSGLGY